MALSWIWVAMAALAVVFGAINGRMDAVSAGAMAGAQSAVELCISLAGPFLLWCGVMETAVRSGLEGKLAALLRPLLRRILPRASRE